MNKIDSILIVGQSFTDTFFKVSLQNQISLLSELNVLEALSQGISVKEDVLDYVFKKLTSNGSLINRSFGGIGPNIGYALSKIGIPTFLITALGTGENSNFFVDKISHNNLKIISNFSLNDIGRCFCFVDGEKDTRTMLTSFPNDHTPAFSNFEELLIDKSFPLCIVNGDLVYFGDKYIKFLKYIKNTGSKVCIVSPEIGYFEKFFDCYKSALNYADIFVCNRMQAEFITNTKENVVTNIRNFIKPSCINMITDGPNDMYISVMSDEKTDICRFKPAEINPLSVVNPVGAGDSAAAGLIFGLTKGLDFYSCAHIASIFGQEGIISPFSHLTESQIYSILNKVSNLVSDSHVSA